MKLTIENFLFRTKFGEEESFKMIKAAGINFKALKDEKWIKENLYLYKNFHYFVYNLFLYCFQKNQFPLLNFVCIQDILFYSS